MRGGSGLDGPGGPATGTGVEALIARVLLWGGLDAHGLVLNDGELFDPDRGDFAQLTTPPPEPALADVPFVAASLPAVGASGVPVTAIAPASPCNSRS